jgi:hypothetical protein
MAIAMRPKRAPILACLALIWTACNGGQPKGDDMSPIVEVEYWSTEADDTHPLSLNFAPGGDAVLWMRCNRDNPAKVTVGEFRKKLEKSDTDPLLKVLDSPEFSASPNPKSALPGESIRRITAKRSDGSTLMRYVGAVVPATATFKNAEALLQRIGDKVRTQPVHAVALKVDPIPVSAQPEQAVTFTVTISNPGDQVLRVPLPKAWEAAETQAEWDGLRSDVPLAEMNNDHRRTLELSAAHLPPSWAPPTPKDFVELPPRGSLALPFTVNFSWEPGAYDLQFSYSSSLTDAQGGVLGRFEWVSPKAAFKVKPKK